MIYREGAGCCGLRRRGCRFLLRRGVEISKVCRGVCMSKAEEEDGCVVLGEEEVVG